MMLDQNLFTLHFSANSKDPNICDLIDPSGLVHYRKQRIPGKVYEMHVYDPLSESLLITVTSPSAMSKTRVLQLHNPSSVVELKYTGLLNFRWSFTWEDHEYAWKKEECLMIRKPDPPVLVAVSSEPPSRLKTASVQILDYNLNRFDIADRKGLEIVILTALFTFQDFSESQHSQDSGEAKAAVAPVPSVPPRPQPKVGVERISEMQAFKDEVNEVTVEDEGDIGDYAKHCHNLLIDDAMLFITIRSSTPSNVQKVLQIVEETKRTRHKAGEDDLHQYVVYERAKTRGPRRINLDDPKDKMKYTPPECLSVHLSKIDIPELRPRVGPMSELDNTVKVNQQGHGKGKDKGQGSKHKDRPHALTKSSQRTGSRDPRYLANKPPPPIPSRSQMAYPSAYGAPSQVSGYYRSASSPSVPSSHPSPVLYSDSTPNLTRTPGAGTSLIDWLTKR